MAGSAAAPLNAVDILHSPGVSHVAQGANLEQDAWRPHLVADVLWGMALAHHWTPRLPEWAALLLRLGGFASLTARHAASVLWAFATLGHAPTALVQVCVRACADKSLEWIAELAVQAQRVLGSVA